MLDDKCVQQLIHKYFQRNNILVNHQIESYNDYIDNIEANTNFHKNHIANLINICDKCHKNIHKTGKQHIVKKTTRDFDIVEV